MQWVRVSARLYTICEDRVRRCCEWECLQDHIRYARIELGDAVSESIYTTIYDSRGWRWAEYPLARSSTVPGGDTPCLTAGDARRVNPWIGEELPHLRHRRCRTASTAAYPSFSLDAFSATPPDSFEYSSICPILGFVSIVLDLHDGEEKGDSLCEGKRWERTI